MQTPLVNPDVAPWSYGWCEAGVEAFPSVNNLPPCSKRARWIVNGILLCGGCKQKVVA